RTGLAEVVEAGASSMGAMIPSTPFLKVTFWTEASRGMCWPVGMSFFLLLPDFAVQENPERLMRTRWLVLESKAISAKAFDGAESECSQRAIWSQGILRPLARVICKAGCSRVRRHWDAACLGGLAGTG